MLQRGLDHCGGFSGAFPQQGPVLSNQGGSEGLETWGNQSGMHTRTGQHTGGPGEEAPTAWTNLHLQGKCEAARDFSEQRLVKGRPRPDLLTGPQAPRT